ncbi:HdeD family acid-resistance protein [Aureivirga sp. CE67]|uniref:HdeD family acid-resistance protein n=1 Tax=Aureivirga sp. CE67 TaxID=1788983 RepID=UPI0018C9DB8A|nr:HdeD family acid-resistance protein [Aureivirga sp. CE67]
MESFFKNWWMVTLRGLILILFGMFAVANPQEAVLVLVLYAGLVALTSGIFLIVMSLSNTRRKYWTWTLFISIVDILFGVMVLAYPYATTVATASLFTVFIGVWALFGAITLIWNAFRFRKESKFNWLIMFLGGVLTCFVAIVIITNPLKESLTITVLIGAFAIIFGFANMIWGLELKKMKDDHKHHS